MRIGILTLPMGNNYGGILQAYALQQTLTSMGHEAVLLDRGWPESRNMRERLSSAVCSLVGLLGRDRITKEECERRTGPELRRFVMQHFGNRVAISPHSYASAAASVRALNLDAIVVGSDQIWRREYARQIGFCYLDFTADKEMRRVAYAASFGLDEWRYSEKETRQCAALLARFDAVSVREESGQRLCAEYLRTEARLMPDPTLLLSAADYRHLFGNENAITADGKALVSYFLGWNDRNREIVGAVASALGLEHRQLCKGIYFGTDPKRVTVLDSVEHWLQSFASARAVVTDSFHGTVFAIINHRQFVTLANKSGGVSRIETLLSHFNLRDRLVDDADNAVRTMHEPIDWAQVDDILAADRKRARDFLTEALG